MKIDYYRIIVELVVSGNVLISEHGYDELVQDKISVKETLVSIERAEVIEYYPDYPKGPCVLVLQRDANNNPIHVVWGIPKNAKEPAVLVTAYRPDPERWSNNFKRRKR